MSMLPTETGDWEGLLPGPVLSPWKYGGGSGVSQGQEFILWGARTSALAFYEILDVGD